MKKQKFPYLLAAFCLFSACGSLKQKDNKIFLKEYAYCRCLQYAGIDSAFFANDRSIAVYRDIADYSRASYDKIDSLAKSAALAIQPIQIADYENKKAILSSCFMFMRSKSLDSLVNKSKRILND